MKYNVRYDAWLNEYLVTSKATGQTLFHAPNIRQVEAWLDQRELSDSQSPTTCPTEPKRAG